MLDRVLEAGLRSNAAGLGSLLTQSPATRKTSKTRLRHLSELRSSDRFSQEARLSRNQLLAVTEFATLLGAVRTRTVAQYEGNRGVTFFCAMRRSEKRDFREPGGSNLWKPDLL